MSASDPHREVGSLMARVAELEDRCKRLEQAPRTYAEIATISNTGGGGAQCAVTYPTGATRALPFAANYTPTLGDLVVVVNSPAKSWVDCKVTA